MLLHGGLDEVKGGSLGLLLLLLLLLWVLARSAVALGTIHAQIPEGGADGVNAWGCTCRAGTVEDGGARAVRLLLLLLLQMHGVLLTLTHSHTRMSHTRMAHALSLRRVLRTSASTVTNASSHNHTHTHTSGNRRDAAASSTVHHAVTPTAGCWGVHRHGVHVHPRARAGTHAGGTHPREACVGLNWGLEHWLVLG